MFGGLTVVRRAKKNAPKRPWEQLSAALYRAAGHALDVPLNIRAHGPSVNLIGCKDRIGTAVHGAAR